LSASVWYRTMPCAVKKSMSVGYSGDTLTP
jgi:hypothetical protein